MAMHQSLRLPLLVAWWWLIACSDDSASTVPATVDEDAAAPTSNDVGLSETASDASSEPSLAQSSAREAVETTDTPAASHPNATAAAATTENTAEAAATENTDAGATDASSSNRVVLPPPNAGLDYQLGGGYTPPEGVGIVARDRTDTPAVGLYNICYVNGFQVQPGEEGDWAADLLLRDENGDVVIDEDWDEALLDVSTEDKRARIAEVVGGWIEGCKADGFDAVEIDNLDTFSRSGARISEDDAVAFVAKLSAVAHAAGLAIAQKNAVELVPRRAEMGTDFVVAEECNTWRECDGYIESYGPYVLMIEYASEDFDVGCAAYGAAFSLVLRDRNLTAPRNEGTYVYDGC